MIVFLLAFDTTRISTGRGVRRQYRSEPVLHQLAERQNIKTEHILQYRRQHFTRTHL